MVIVREALHQDIPAIFHVRFSVRENLLSEEQLRQHVTPESLAVLLKSQCKGWIAEEDGQVIAFSIADSKTRSIWALFVLPQHEGRGLGRQLLDPAVAWLWKQGADRIWLTTAPDTRAAGFYRHLGWSVAGTTQQGEFLEACAEAVRSRRRPAQSAAWPASGSRTTSSSA